MKPHAVLHWINRPRNELEHNQSAGVKKSLWLMAKAGFRVYIVRGAALDTADVEACS